MFSVLKKLYLKKISCLTLAVTLFCAPLTSTIKAQEQKNPIADAMVTAAAIIAASYGASYLQKQLANWWYHSEKKPDTKEKSVTHKSLFIPESKELVLPEVIEHIITQFEQQKIPTQEQLQQAFDWFSDNVASPEDIINVLSNPEHHKIIVELLNLLISITTGNLVGVITDPTFISLLSKIIIILKDVLNGKSKLANNDAIQQLINFVKKNIQSPADLLKICENIQPYTKKQKKLIVKKDEKIKPKHCEKSREQQHIPEQKQQQFILKKSPHVKYFNGGRYTYQPLLHSSQELAQIIAKLRTRTMTADDIDENIFWELVNFIEQYMTLDSHSEQDRRVLHELGKIRRATPIGQEELQKNLASLGGKPAASHITSFIHNLLKEKGCPVWDVPVYQLTNNESKVAGTCSSQAIWIRCTDSLDKKTLIHEAGHWFYQHGFHAMLDKKYLVCDCNNANRLSEYEADNFVYEQLPENERRSYTKAVHSGRIWRGEPYDSNWLRIAQEHGEMRK